MTQLTTTTTSFSQDDNSPRLLYDRRLAARQLSISERSIDYLIARGKLKTRRIGKKVLVPYADLVRYSRCDHPEAVDASS